MAISEAERRAALRSMGVTEDEVAASLFEENESLHDQRVKLARDLIYRTVTGTTAPAPVDRTKEKLAEAEKNRQSSDRQAYYAMLANTAKSRKPPELKGLYTAQTQAATLSKNMTDEIHKRAVKDASVLQSASTEQQKRLLKELDYKTDMLDKLNGIRKGSDSKALNPADRIKKVALSIIQTRGSLNRPAIGGTTPLTAEDVARFIRQEGGLYTAEELRALKAEVLKLTKAMHSEWEEVNQKDFDTTYKQFNSALESLAKGAESDPSLMSSMDPSKLNAKDQAFLAAYDTPEGYAALGQERAALVKQARANLPKYDEVAQAYLRKRLGDPTFAGSVAEAARREASANVPVEESKLLQQYQSDETRLYEAMVAADPSVSAEYRSQPAFQKFKIDNKMATDQGALELLYGLSSAKDAKLPLDRNKVKTRIFQSLQQEVKPKGFTSPEAQAFSGRSTGGDLRTKFMPKPGMNSDPEGTKGEDNEP